MRRRPSSALILVLVCALSACATPSSGGAVPGASPGGGASTTPRQERTLNVALEIEPKYISSLAPTISATAGAFFLRPFSAYLEFVDEKGQPGPYLVEALPTLNTDSWKVFPDGRMETSYRVRPNLTWHDGAPLTAGDFAFAFRMATPAAGFSTAGAPYSVIDDVLAPDDRTLIIHWKELYPDAAVLQGGGARFGLPPFPRHLLEKSFLDDARDVFANHPYWSREFVGAGPYKLERWELGAFIDAVPFDGHVFGRPRIDRIHFVFPGDPSTVVASLKAGAVHLALNAITFQQSLDLKREWAQSGTGTGTFTATSTASVLFQFRPDFAKPAGLRDVRVRRALAYGVDKQTLLDEVWGGELTRMDSIFEPTTAYYPTIEQSMTKYLYDPRTAERLMNEAGFAKAADGFFASPNEGRLTIDFKSSEGRAEHPVLADGWRRNGFDTPESTIPRALFTDPEARGSFPGMYLNVFAAQEGQQMTVLLGSQAGGPENRWRGENRGGWINPEFDRLVGAFNVTLDPGQRIQQRAQIARVMSEEVPSIVLSFNPNAHAYLSSLKNIVKPSLYTTGLIGWNVDKWELD